MKGIFLLLGTNLGDKVSNLQTAIDLLKEQELGIVDYSSVYESAPWGDENQGWFLNIVLRIDTFLQPDELLRVCLKTEEQMGRKRLKKWGERSIDIDILYFDNLTQNANDLIIPHPGIAMRKFTLLPLEEIAPKEIHPLLNMTQSELLEICPDELKCKVSKIQLNI